MSLFTLLSTAVAVPMFVVFMIFSWFFLKAQLGEKNPKSKKVKKQKTTHNNHTAPPHTTVSLSSSFASENGSISNFPNAYDAVDSDNSLSYQPLSSYLGESTESSYSNMSSDVATLIPDASTIQFDIKDIPGINETIENELMELGYSSVEQIARWGRADVRAVSSTLGIDQQKIEDDWIAGARLILSIR